jgi:uncharacterized protein YdhG (YjbR/CyaY superfamily)
MIRAAAPKEATEAISDRIPSFKYKGTLVGYAAFADHCSFFPFSGALLDEFADDLKSYSVSKGTIRFALDKPLPAALVKRLVKAKVAQNESQRR